MSASANIFTKINTQDSVIVSSQNKYEKSVQHILDVAWQNENKKKKEKKKRKTDTYLSKNLRKDCQTDRQTDSQRGRKRNPWKKTITITTITTRATNKQYNLLHFVESVSWQMVNSNNSKKANSCYKTEKKKK